MTRNGYTGLTDEQEIWAAIDALPEGDSRIDELLYDLPPVPKARVKALDLFAGTGWGVACQRLGIKEAGVEIMPEAVATRTANGMDTIYNDVWDGLQLTQEQHRDQYGSYGLLIASPPCQTFSMAGNGKGREALNEVIEAIELHAYKDAEALRAFGEKHDPRTALVLTPLAYVWRDRPRLVAMEQVPTVLPVWEACADVMREWGYDVKVEVLNAEQYGVPQTRKRAILVARRNGPVHMPVPTHSRYYSRTPDKLDPGVQKWVSMAEALGWTAPGVTFTQNNKQAHQAHRTMEQPAPTVTAGHDSGNRGFIDGDSFTVATPDEVAALQSYPHTVRTNSTTGTGYVPGGPRQNYGRSTEAPAPTVVSRADLWKLEGNVVYRNGNQANASKRTPDQPAPTILFGHNSNKVEWMDPELAGIPSASGTRVTVGEASALQSYPGMLRSNYGTGGDASNRGERTIDQPAPTLTSKADRNKWDGKDQMSADQAGTLQTYEKPFVWCGSKSKQFLQIGNAVPPVLAEAVLAALIGLKPGR